MQRLITALRDMMLSMTIIIHQKIQRVKLLLTLPISRQGNAPTLNEEVL